MIKCVRTSLANVCRIKLIARSYSDFPSDGSESGNGVQSSKDNITEFFRKAQQKVAAEQQAAKQLPEYSLDEPSDAESTKDNVEMNEAQRTYTAIHNFVPYSMGHLLQEMNIHKLLSRRRPDESQSFATLFRNSPFVQLGDFKGREVIGVVIENVNDNDLYIDFGGKFHCVCQQPPNQHYPRGTLVRIRLRDPEMTNRFMINANSITLCEADAILIGPYRGRVVQTGQEGAEMDAYYSRVPVKRDSAEAEQSSKDRPATENDSVFLDHWRLL